MAIVEVGNSSYHMDDKIFRHWEDNSLVKMKKSNSDRVYIVDGMERSGKSTFAFQCAGALDKKMFENPETFATRICFTPEESLKAMREITNGVVIFDEAFRGMSSRAALSKVNKKLISGMMEMGQNNNILFIVLPRIFLLDMYPAMLRSNGLFNISLDRNTSKRVWKGYNYEHKNIIYQMGGKKGWQYPVKTPFKGYFYNKFPGDEYKIQGGEKIVGPFETAYLAKKRKAFMELEKSGTPAAKEAEEIEILRKRLALMTKLANTQGNSFKFLSKKLKEERLGLSAQRLNDMVLNSTANAGI